MNASPVCFEMQKMRGWLGPRLSRLLTGIKSSLGTFGGVCGCGWPPGRPKSGFPAEGDRRGSQGSVNPARRFVDPDELENACGLRRGQGLGQNNTIATEQNRRQNHLGPSHHTPHVSPLFFRCLLLHPERVCGKACLRDQGSYGVAFMGG